MKKIYKMQAVLLAACVFTGLAGCGREKSNIMTITNVSYDATREFYESYNEIFKSYYEEKYGEPVNVIQSHAGSGSQARSVVEGCNADVVTLALEHDISLIEKTGLVDSDWKQEYDNDSAPYTSTMVFLVRKGNEKNIKDWDDLIKDGVEVITPDPKSSGGACWNFLAALSYAREKYTDIVGLAFLMTFGRLGWFYPVIRWFNSVFGANVRIAFAIPGVVLATIFVTFPFVSREIIPVLNAQGKDEEEAAALMGAGGFKIFFKITFPQIKWALTYRLRTGRMY